MTKRSDFENTMLVILLAVVAVIIWQFRIYGADYPIIFRHPTKGATYDPNGAKVTDAGELKTPSGSVISAETDPLFTAWGYDYDSLINTPSVDYLTTSSVDARIESADHDITGAWVFYGTTQVMTDPTSDYDVVNKRALDLSVYGLSWQEPVDSKTTLNPPDEPTTGTRYIIAGGGDWYSDAWGYRAPITIDESYVTTDSLTNIPICVNYADETDSGTVFSTAQSDGDDIIFTKADGTTRIPHETEYFNTTSGTKRLVSWVKIDSLSGTAPTQIYMYWGNSVTPSTAAPEQVWDSDYILVQHLKETSGNTQDSTIYNNDGVPINTPNLGVAGKLGLGTSFNYLVDEYLRINKSSTMYPSSAYEAITLEFWLNSAGATSTYQVFMALPSFAARIYMNAARTTLYMGLTDNETVASTAYSVAQTIATGTWYHIAMTYDMTTEQMILYCNGVPIKTGAKTGHVRRSSAIGYIGNYGTSYDVYGTMDEPRISKIARTPDWMETQYNNIAEADFLSVGAVETQETTGTWMGRVNDIATWMGDYWSITDAKAGYACWVEDESCSYVFNGAEWVKLTQIGDHNTLGGLQGGTSAQYYHLTSSQYTVATREASNTQSGIMPSGKLTSWDAAYTRVNAIRAINGIVKGDGAGVYSAVTDNSTNWNTAYTQRGYAGTKDVDETDIADGRFLRYNSSTGKIVYSTGVSTTNADTLDGYDSTYFLDASHISSGTLGTDYFSAYADLTAEDKIGTGAAQVAAGDHNHDSDYLTTSSVAAGIESGDISNWDNAYGWGNHSGLYVPIANKWQWDGGSTNLVAATGRTSLGLGSIALKDDDDYLTSDSAVGFNPENTIIVAKSGGDYTTIQAAVDAATTGTTVLVFPGEYAEEVSINKPISLIGTDKTNCVIKKSVVGNGGAGDHLVTVEWGIASAYVEIRGLTMWNTYNSYSSTALKINSPAKVRDCNLISNQADTLILGYGRASAGIYVDDCYVSGAYDTVSIAGVENTYKFFINNCQITATNSGSNTMPIWVGNGNLTANISNCDLITASATGSSINVDNDSGKTIRLNIVNCRSIKSDYTPMPLFYSGHGTGTTAYIANCQYSEIGNSNVTVNYLASSAINTSAVSIGAEKFTVDANGNITKINNVTTSFPSSQGDANTYLKNDGSGNLSWAEGGGGGATGDIEVDSIMVGTAAVPSSGIGSQGDIATSGILRGNSLTINGTSVITSARALQNVTLPSHKHSGTDINSGTVGDSYLSSNIPKKDSVNAFKNFVSIEKTATDNLLTLTGGTITPLKHVLKVTGTMPATSDPVTYNRIVDVQATSGNSGKNEYAFNMELLAGGTAPCFNAAGRYYNERAGTGAAGFGSWSGASNNAVAGQASSTTTGYNYGGTFDARGGNLSVGVQGLATTAKNSAKNIGVFGNAYNSGSSPVHIGGMFALNTTTVPSVSAALLCDNGAVAANIFVARDNGTAKVTIADGGNVTLEGNLNVKGTISSNSNAGITVSRSWVDASGNTHTVEVIGGLITSWEVIEP